jgi:hypothetical protein
MTVAPSLLALLALKSLVWMPFVLVLALVRVAVARGPSRGWAVAALLVAGAGVAGQVLPGLLGLYDGVLVIGNSQWRAWGGGWASLVMASGPLLLSGIAPGSRWWGIDLVHILGGVALIGLWGYVQWI